jgi:O-methyltransferase domain/Dimerisation domain
VSIPLATDDSPSPAGQLLNLASGYWISQAIYVAAELGIADHLGRKGRDIDDLAQVTGTHAPSLYRLMRALASVGVFSEIAPRSFALAPMSVLLREDTPGNLRAFSRMQGDPWHWGCWGDALHAIRTGQSAITKRENVVDCFDYLTRHPASAQVFDAAMSGYSAHVCEAIIDAYDFSRARSIVDIGGGTGILLGSILASNAQARGILFDRDNVLARATGVLEEIGVSERCTRMAGDLFGVIPEGCDLYLMSAILHDWSDADATRILTRVAAAMRPSSRLLVVEHVLAPGNQRDHGKFIDLEMLLITGGRERTKHEYETLLGQAQLHCERIIPTTMPVSILEARRP